MNSHRRWIAKIVRGLKTFSRNHEHDSLIAVSFSQAIVDASSLCTEKFKKVEVEFNIEANENIFVSCIPTLLSQVILNLLNNSFDAVSNQQKKWIRVQLTEINGKALLKISDSGPGISREIQDKIMQPFFTTKPVGQGTGLGLSISKGIINSFEGQIYYDSAAINTCFVVELPLSKSEKILRAS